MAKKENKNLFQKLTQLFRSGPIVKRKIRTTDTAIAVPDKTKSSGALLFQKSSSPTYATITANAYNLSERLMRYQDFGEMEYCLHADTKIAVPGGYKTISDLAKECEGNPDHTFLVYTYDHNLQRLVPTFGKQARQTRVDEAYTVTFDNGKKIVGTPNHRLMKRDGTFCKIEDLKPGDAMMPFYRRDLFNGCKEEGEGYRWIYTMDRRSKMNGWVAEHRVIGEMIKGCPLADGEVVHHRNFVKHDNRPENLEVMTEADHLNLHAKILNGAKWSESNSEWIQQFKVKHSKFMSENNPAERKDITFGRILEVAERTGFNSRKMCEVLDTDPNVIKRRLRKHGYQNFETFARAYNPDWCNGGWDNRGEKNPRYVKSVTFDKICSHFSKGMSNQQLANSLNTTIHVIEGRIRERGYKNYGEFASTYDNLKVVSVEPYGVIPLYDLTVDGYKNFATDTVVSHNTPELASALDIYADETCAQDEKGRVLHIYSDNEKIKEILEDLFYNTLNVEFNLRSWVRNIVKYGDFFLYNDVSPTHGVINAFPIPVNEIEREENYDPNDPMAVRFRWVSLGNRTLENWEISHFRLLGNDMFLPYGSSVIEPARRIWRQLILIEDAMLVYRVVRAPERRVFYIDVANIPPENVPMYVEEQRKNLRSSQVIDKSTGRVDLRYNPLCLSLQSLIKLQDGRTLDLSTLIKEWESGKQDQWVYSIDHETKNVVPGKVVWAGITRKNAELVRVWLDDGTYHDTTPDHRFMLRDGTYKKAEDLTQGESLMPLYTKLSSKEEGDSIVGYEKIYDPATGKFLLTHRNNVIVNEGFDAIIGKVIHHADFNKKNNTPSNLVPMSWKDHQKLHGDLCVERNRSPAGRECSKNRMKKTWKEGKINKQTFVDLWNDEKIRQLRINKLTKSIDDNRLVEFCFSAMDRLRTGLSTKESALLDSLNADEKFVSYMNENNADFKNGFSDKISRSYLQTHLKLFGFKKSIEDMKRAWLLSRIGTKNLVSFCKMNVTATRKDILAHFNINRTSYNWLASQVSGSVNEFAKVYMPAAARYMRKPVSAATYMNHKVSRVERLTRTEDTGCITVEKYHNFAVQGLHGVNTASDKLVNSFIYLHNSVDEDYFIPVRGGETGTRIETLAGGQNTAAVEDVAYIQKKLFAALKIPRAYLGYDEALCLLGSNRVPLFDGRTLTVEELVQEFTENPDKQNYVYSSDENGSIKPGKILNAWKTKEVDHFYRVNLDSGGHIDCTGNHPFLCRDGQYKQADELISGQSLMPLYRKLSSLKDRDFQNGYEKIFNNETCEWEYTHRLVARNISLEKDNSWINEGKRVIHHIDFNKLNNNPVNLIHMGMVFHAKLHAASAEALQRPESRERLRQVMKTDKYVKRHKSAVQAAWNSDDGSRSMLVAANNAKYKQKNIDLAFASDIANTCTCRKEFYSKIGLSRNGFTKTCFRQGIKSTVWLSERFNKLLHNHKVVSVEIIKLQQPVAVYDIEVEKWHNFAVGSDRIRQLQKGVSGGDDYVFVHNSSKATLAQEDIRFSRTISVIQKTVIAELNKLAIIHLYANGFDSEDLQSFTLHMSNPSTVAQQQKLELWRAKFEIAGSAPEGQMSKEFIRKEIWGLNEQQCKDIDEQRLKEKLVDAAIEGAEAPDAAGDEADAGTDDAAATDDAATDDAAGGAEDLFAGDDVGNKNPELKLLTMADDPVDDEDLPIDFSSLDVDIPVKAQTQLHKAMYNRGRINHHGPAKTHMPDFEKMLSPRKSDADIYDQTWTSSYLRNPFGESVTRQQHKTPIGNDVMSSLRKMSLSPKFVASSTQTDINTGLLKEEIEDQADEKEYNEVLIIDDDI